MEMGKHERRHKQLGLFLYLHKKQLKSLMSAAAVHTTATVRTASAVVYAALTARLARVTAYNRNENTPRHLRAQRCLFACPV